MILLQAAILGGVFMLIGYVVALLIGVPVYLAIVNSRIKGAGNKKTFLFWKSLGKVFWGVTFITIIYIIFVLIFDSCSDYKSFN